MITKSEAIRRRIKKCELLGIPIPAWCQRESSSIKRKKRVSKCLELGLPIPKWCKRKRCSREERIKYRDKLHEIKLKSGCVGCGFNKHPAALQFDHLPGHVKLFGISSAINKSWYKVEAEIKKCEVVCANCHAIRTYNRSESSYGYQALLF